MPDRLFQLLRCVAEIQMAIADQRTSNPGALLGELDWREELYYQLRALIP